MASRSFSYMQLANAKEVEKIYASYRKDASSVEASWRHFFEGMEFGSFAPKESGADLRLYGLIDAYRKFGHLKAKTNPLQIGDKHPHELDLTAIGFKKDELDRLFPTHGLLEAKEAPLSSMIATLEEIYCGSVSVEYMGCHSPDLERWIQKKVEKSRFRPRLSKDEQKELFFQLNRAELFETFIHKRYVGQKRFSLEGAETLIPIVSDVIDFSGVAEVVIGMAHRGRLNVLANVLDKSYREIFGEFEDLLEPDCVGGDGDVKYHKGYSSIIKTRSGKEVHISLTPNPSHLESVNPVAMGKAYAKKLQGSTVLPILIHGDSSIAGQGIVYEALQLSGLPGYSTDGTIHLIINNQVGFTTLPEEYRSTSCSTDIAHAFSIPVFHVNAEDPQACAYVSRLACEIRQEFACDVFIELNGYRKYGHNESDEPAYTQPIEYDLIKKKKSIRSIYHDQLLEEGVVEASFVKEAEEQFHERLNFAVEEMKIKPYKSQSHEFGEKWTGFFIPGEKQLIAPHDTSVGEERLREVLQVMTGWPDGFAIHKKLVKLLEKRSLALEEGVDWGTAEQLAFGTLLQEGVPVRVSGQDSQRGTFSQRHALFVDQTSGERFAPLSHLGEFTVYNSPLAEFGVMGFEFGYSLVSPHHFVAWEAQFGDFANGAQVIIDQYLSCSASKWRRSSGLVLLLPHGYEGQGSEHSSARLERFLQLSAAGNWRIVNPSTPAQYFHLLRMQMATSFRAPMIIMTPKELLRHPRCLSLKESFTEGSFQHVLRSHAPKPRKLIFCSGHIAYDLLDLDEIEVVRIEQLYPLDQEGIAQVIDEVGPIQEILWVQEEPKNMGAWSALAPQLSALCKQPVIYVGREAASAPATSSPKRHQAEKAAIIERVLS